MKFNKILIDHSFNITNRNTTLRSSVISRISWHSELYWAVRKWQIQNKRELSKASSSNLNCLLLLIAVRYFNMNTEERKLKGLSGTRFSSMIFLFRMAGIPFQMKNVSKLCAVYMITVITCSWSTFIGTVFDVYIHRDDLGRTMTTMRILIPLTNIMGLFSYCR